MKAHLLHECQSILICNMNLADGGETTSHHLTEDLLVFHNNQCVKPSLFTLFAQRRGPRRRPQRLHFTALVDSGPIAFMNKHLHPFGFHASVGAGYSLEQFEQVFRRLTAEWPSVPIHSYFCILYCIVYIFPLFDFNSWMLLTHLEDLQLIVPKTHIYPRCLEIKVKTNSWTYWSVLLAEFEQWE